MRLNAMRSCNPWGGKRVSIASNKSSIFVLLLSGLVDVDDDSDETLAEEYKLLDDDDDDDDCIRFCDIPFVDFPCVIVVVLGPGLYR